MNRVCTIFICHLSLVQAYGFSSLIYRMVDLVESSLPKFRDFSAGFLLVRNLTV